MPETREGARQYRATLLGQVMDQPGKLEKR